MSEQFKTGIEALAFLNKKGYSAEQITAELERLRLEEVTLDNAQLMRVRELVTQIAEGCDPYAVGLTGDDMRELLRLLHIDPARLYMDYWK